MGDANRRMSDSDLELLAQASAGVLELLDSDALTSLRDRLRQSRDMHRDVQRRDAQLRTGDSGSRAVAADVGAAAGERLAAVESALTAVEGEFARREAAESADLREQRLGAARSRGGAGGATPGAGKAGGPGATPGRKPTPRDRNQSAVTRSSQKRNQARRDGR